MRYLFEEKPSLEELEHFGVKGMHWGVRKELSPGEQRKQDLKKAIAKRDKIDAELFLVGTGIRGHQFQKMYKKAVKKDPNFAVSKLSPEDQAAYYHRATTKAIRGTVIQGTVGMALALVGGNIAVNRVHLSPQNRQGARIAVALLAGQVGRLGYHQIKAIKTAENLPKIQDQIASLQNPKKK